MIGVAELLGVVLRHEIQQVLSGNLVWRLAQKLGDLTTDRRDQPRIVGNTERHRLRLSTKEVGERATRTLIGWSDLYEGQALIADVHRSHPGGDRCKRIGACRNSMGPIENDVAALQGAKGSEKLGLVVVTIDLQHRSSDY